MSSASKRYMMLEMQLRVELKELMIWGISEPESDGRLTFPVQHCSRFSSQFSYFVNPDMYEELVKAEDRLREEQKQFAQMEMVLEDVLRECMRPTIVPALLGALTINNKS